MCLYLTKELWGPFQHLLPSPASDWSQRAGSYEVDLQHSGSAPDDCSPGVDQAKALSLQRDHHLMSVPFASMLWPPNIVQKGTRYVQWKIHEVDFVFCCLPPMEFQALCAQLVQS